jgi:predicted dehydrogenase
MKLALIGGSGHYHYVLSALAALPHVKLAAFAPGSNGEDLGKLRAALAGQSLAPSQYTDWQVMLDREQPDLVAVNPHFGDHGAINAECLRRGIHLYAEKPLATTQDELATLEALWRASDVQLGAMFGIRYKPWFMAAWQAVQAGEIGAVQLMHAQKSYRLGTRPAFFCERQRFGGLIPWVGCHAIDWLRWFSGREFVSVSAMHSSAHNGGHGDLEASAACLFALEDGISATVNIDYLRPAAAPSHDDDRLRVVGSTGIVEVRGQEAWLLNANGMQALPLAVETSCFADFVRSIGSNHRCLVSGEDALRSTRASLIAREAADCGQLLKF